MRALAITSDCSSRAGVWVVLCFLVEQVIVNYDKALPTVQEAVTGDVKKSDSRWIASVSNARRKEARCV